MCPSCSNVFDQITQSGLQLYLQTHGDDDGSNVFNGITWWKYKKFQKEMQWQFQQNIVSQLLKCVWSNNLKWTPLTPSYSCMKGSRKRLQLYLQTHGDDDGNVCNGITWWKYQSSRKKRNWQFQQNIVSQLLKCVWSNNLKWSPLRLHKKVWQPMKWNLFINFFLFYANQFKKVSHFSSSLLQPYFSWQCKFSFEEEQN